MSVETSPMYWAALIDGEGWITMYKHRRGERYRKGFELIPNVGICLTKGAWIFNELAKKYGGNLYKRRPTNENWKPVTTYSLRYKDISPFLRDILPYLKIKRKQAELLIEYFEIRGERNMNGLYPEVKKRQIEIYNELRLLNTKGNIVRDQLSSDISSNGRNYMKFDADTLKILYWDEALSMVDIAKKYGVSFDAVRNAFSDYKIPLRKRSEYAKMGSEKSDKIKLFATKEQLEQAYVIEGKSTREVGKQFGVTHVQVIKTLRRYGIQARERKGAARESWVKKGLLNNV